MALGKNSIIIDSDELVKGMTTSDNLTDGGFSPYSEAVNTLTNPGVVYATNGASTIGTLGTSRIVSSTYDNNKSATNTISKWLIDTAGSIWYVNTGSVTSPVSISGTYNYGQSMMLPFLTNVNGANIYVTSTTDVGLITVNDTTPASTSTNATWWTVTKGMTALQAVFPHPMAIFNKILFIADGNMLHTWDGTTATYAVLTLIPTEVITAIDTDPATGRLILGIASKGAISTSRDFALQMYTNYFVGLYDGVNPTQLIRKIPVDAPVTAWKNCGGKMMCFYGGNLGVWTGSGISLKRRFHADTLGTIYSNTVSHMSNIGNLLFYTDNQPKSNPHLSNVSYSIDMIGEVTEGIETKTRFISSNNQFSFVDVLYDGPSNNVGVLYSQFISTNEVLYWVPIYQTASTLATHDSSPVFVTKRLSFPRPSQVNLVRVFFEDAVAADGTTLGTLSLIDDQLTSAVSLDIVNPTGGATTKWFDLPCDVLTTQCQVKYQWKETSTNHGIQKIMVFYTPYE